MKIIASILMLMCTVWQLQAQNKYNQPTYIHFLLTFGNNPHYYDYRGIPGKTGMTETDFGLVFYGKPVENYQEYQAAIRLIIPIGKKLKFMSRFNLGRIYYEFSQYSGTYSTPSRWIPQKTNFVNYGLRINLYGGIGKTFSLGKKKQFSIIPNILMGFDARTDYIEPKGIAYWDSYPEGSFRYNDQIRVGTELNLAFQYMLTTKWGVTVSFERLVYGYFKREKQESSYKLEETQYSKHIEYFIFPNNVFFGLALSF
jgi:hypothetical protein